MVCPSIPFLAGGTTYTNSLLVSVATHLAFGGGLFYGVLKFFEEVEKKLNPDTRLGIAVWLLDLHPSQNVQGWRSTFAKIFERVFGWKHMSWKCFWRSCAVTVIMTLIVMLARTAASPIPKNPVLEAVSLVLLFGSGVVGGPGPGLFVSLENPVSNKPSSK
jgi:hypothetical protein